MAPLSVHLPVHLCQLFLQAVDSLLYDSPVGLDLGLTHAASGSAAAPLPFEVGPHACKPGEHVVVFCQLDLHFGIGTLCPLRKNLEN